MDDGSVFSDRLQIRFFYLKVAGKVSGNLQKAACWCKFIAGSTDPKVLEELGSIEEWKEEFGMAMKAHQEISAEERTWAYHLSCDRAEADYNNGLKAAEERGLQKGLQDGIAQSLRKLIANTGMTTEEAMAALGIAEEERERYAAMLPS